MDLTFLMDISAVLQVVEGADPYRYDLLCLKKNEKILKKGINSP